MKGLSSDMSKSAISQFGKVLFSALVPMLSLDPKKYFP